MAMLENSIIQQRSYIEELLLEPLQVLASLCASNLGNRIALDAALNDYLIKNTHRCSLLYVIDKKGKQCSSNISDVIIDDTIVGQNLSQRPYLETLKNKKEPSFLLSDVYLDKQSRKPCITALHRIIKDGKFQGYIAADIELKSLPLKNVYNHEPQNWRQIKGDPSIRSTLFQQTRAASAMDKHLDEVLDVVESLITEQSIFHAKLHFSSSRATLWPYDDPYNYRLHVLDEIIDPKVCLVYAKMPYPENASVSADKVHMVLKVFKALREADETIYLRAASLNIINGLVGLNFSCDGSHYIPVDEFLENDLSFWFGNAKQCIVSEL